MTHRLPLHQHCLFKRGIPLGELWFFTELAMHLRQAKRSSFLLTAPPLRLTGAVGSPRDAACRNGLTSADGAGFQPRDDIADRIIGDVGETDGARPAAGARQGQPRRDALYARAAADP